MDRTRSVNICEPVAVAAVADYDEDAILGALASADEACTLLPPCLSGKKVVIKPNLVAKRAPEAAATTHPAVLRAVIRWLRSKGADDITVAESPGGVYSAARLRGVYSATGTETAASACGASLNYDCSFSETSCPDGVRCRLFDIITPILEADVIVDVCKLKTHSLTGTSAAVKNMFGTVPGIVKFEMHSRFPDYGDFSEMLVDLCRMMCLRADFVAVTDGIVAMEGNGPTAGKPRRLGALLASKNPFSSDVAAEHLIGMDGRTQALKNAAARGLCPASADAVPLVTVGGAPEPVKFALPDSVDKNGIEIMKNLFGGRIYKMFAPYPVINYAACVGCGECANSCPRHTIKMVPPEEAGRGARGAGVRRVPKIERDGCIRCFCCQELCPHGVVKIKKNPLTRRLS